MLPFLSDALEKSFRQLLRIGVKPYVIENAVTPLQLVKLDVNDKRNLLNVANIDLGTAANARLKDIVSLGERKRAVQQDLH